MISTKVLLVSALCLFGIVAAQETFKDCLQKDSISCVQLAVRQIMDYYKKKNIGLYSRRTEMSSDFLDNKKCLIKLRI